MRFPIIEVKDKYLGYTHIVGTDIHDTLVIEANGLIGYYNLQCGDGTSDGYSFVGHDNGDGALEVRFVDFDELKQIVEGQKKR